jgi:hypothetical protein
MLFLRAALFTVAGVVVGVAAAVGVVATCNAVNNTVENKPDWIIIPGIAVLVLGPVAGGIAGLVVALRTGRTPPP